MKLLAALPLGNTNCAAPASCGLCVLALHSQAPVVAQTSMLPASIEFSQTLLIFLKFLDFALFILTTDRDVDSSVAKALHQLSSRC